MSNQELPSPTTVEQWVRDINQHGKNLNLWEQQFMAKITRGLSHGWKFTPKEIQIIERIYANKTPL